MNRALFLASAPIAAALLAACGTTDGARPIAGRSTDGSTPGTSSPRATAGHNAQDVMFAQMMIPHHRQATVMADLAATRASSPQVKRLAAQIKNAQRPEIEKMTGWLRAWGEPTRPPGGMHRMEGMMTEQDLKRLGTLSGTAFDKKFLHMMIEHHQGAVTMARTEQEQGTDPDARALAASIVTSQSAEIATMRRLLAGMGPG